MDETSEKTRRTVTLTHKQLASTGLIGLVVALAPYLKETFLTREDGAKLTIEMTYVRQDIADLKTTVEKMPDKIDALLKQSAKQVQRDVDRNERRVENLEAYILRGKTKNL